MFRALERWVHHRRQLRRRRQSDARRLLAPWGRTPTTRRNATRLRSGGWRPRWILPLGEGRGRSRSYLAV